MFLCLKLSQKFVWKAHCLNMAPINKENNNAKGSFKYCSQTESFSKEKKYALMCENRRLKLMKYLFLWKKKELFNILKKGLESQDNN